MKRTLFILVAALCLFFTSCYKESHYSVEYHDQSTSLANITLFEYDYNYDLVKTQEIKYAEPGKIYDLTSSNLAHYVVVGVEGTVNGRIIEWYSANTFQLDSSKPIHIDVSFVGMSTSEENPVNPSNHVHRYFHK